MMHVGHARARMTLSALLLAGSAVAAADTRVVIDTPALADALRAAPPEGQGPGTIIDLPMPDGSWTHVEAWESPVMAPSLAVRFPSIRTFVAQGVDDPSATARLDVTPAGVHALYRGSAGAVLLGPEREGVPGVLISRRWEDATGPMDCEVVVDDDHPAPPPPGEGYASRGPAERRVVRFAMACTGEFAQFHSARMGHESNLEDALSAVVTITNRVNVVLENDLAVRLVLVPNEDAVIYLDPESDPYDPDSSSANLGQNIATVNFRVGLDNYDLGHLVTRIPGGVSFLGSLCQGYKAGGISGTPRTIEPDPLSGEVVMHEVGHQLAANHSFNGIVDRCLGNINHETAWEPGSGTTLMSYTGGCPVGNDPPQDNIALVRDFNYHVGNIREMRAFLDGPAVTCAPSQPQGNTAPTFGTLTFPNGLTIPRLTPFRLNAHLNDAQGDTLTYSWEEMDIGPQQSLRGPDRDDNGASPIFRCFPPTLSGERLLPRLEDILSGEQTPGEQMPSVGNVVRKFRVAVRDNHAGEGGLTVSGVVNIAIADNAAAFRVLTPAAGDALPAGPAVVRWDVAGTDAAPVGTSTIAIRLSTDGGLTFPISLGEFPNTGAVHVDLPPARVPDARLRIDAIDNIFFAVSPPFRVVYCDPDVNCDGAADGFDVRTIERAVAGDLADFCGASPDFNDDGNLDGFDVQAVETAVGGVCE